MKLDLHTHCHEATGLVPLTPEIVRKIVEAARSRGLDGIAVTEHWDKNYGYKFHDMTKQEYGDSFLIIPGQELYVQIGHVVELYLPNNTVFRFLAHPGYPYHPSYPGQFPDPNGMTKMHGVEIENGMNGFCIDKKQVMEVAQQYKLLLLRNSDAHFVDRIGQFYNEIELEELYAKAEPLAPSP
ncbi:MAG: PHP domain-containing protein [Chloroflexota bacterium]|nr:PHP domain-containing protein [Chloroflexota bacterium]